MKLIVGLGNYGDEYESTRHNAGFIAVDGFIEKIKKQKVKTKSEEWNLNSKKSLLYFWLNEDVEVIKPQTYMNKSGSAVKDVASAHPELSTQDILVIHDDWSFPLGEFKLQFDKGANRHNGVQHIIDTLGTREFWRLRIGIGGESDSRQDQSASDYVLSQFTRQEKESLSFLISSEIVPEIENWINAAVSCKL